MMQKAINTPNITKSTAPKKRNNFTTNYNLFIILVQNILHQINKQIQIMLLVTNAFILFGS